MNKVFKVGLIGCGHIAETYFRAHKYFNNFKIIKCADINNHGSNKCAKIYGIKALSVNDLLNDNEVEIILNLTIPKAHYQVAKFVQTFKDDHLNMTTIIYHNSWHTHRCIHIGETHTHTPETR